MILADAASHPVPGLLPVAPFAALLLCIAILPLIERTEHWWHKNQSKLMVALILGMLTLLYYQFRGYGFGHGEHAAEPGFATVLSVLDHAILVEFIPFISLLFSLYVISGGISIRGDIPAHPSTNVAFLGIGGLLASLIGTTGASMLLIRPLLSTNAERKHVVHTVVFFIFIVSNIGGCLLPIGDPPLFLGFLRGVPFLWTLGLWKQWFFCMVILLAIYYLWDSRAYRTETPQDIHHDEMNVKRIAITGKVNFLWLAGVVLATATLDTSKPFPGTDWTPFPFLREIVQLSFVGLSLVTTATGIRKGNNFNYTAILEVACLFIGIFICMQVPIEILNDRGASLGINTPNKFFWATGILSSFLDNAPTYVVFFETANAMTREAGPGTLQLLTGGIINEAHLIAISLGAVFMGANTYIGNGPNFMVKSIAENSGVRMPSFFGYMIYSVMVLVPVFILITILFV